MQAILDRYGTGISVSKVTMQNAQPPEQVQASFDDAVRAGQDRERQKNEGQAYANDVIPKARGMAARLNEEAEGYKQRVIEQAEGDASRFRQVVVEYAKAPQVTRDRLYIEAMQQIMQNTSKVLVDQKGGNNLLYLPLDKLMQMTGTPTAETANLAVVEAHHEGVALDGRLHTRLIGHAATLATAADRQLRRRPIRSVATAPRPRATAGGRSGPRPPRRGGPPARRCGR